MKYLHKYQTLSAFTEDYNGSGYTEPWISYTVENTEVNYNKHWLRIPQYRSEQTVTDEGWTDEELNILNDFFSTFKIIGFDYETANTGTTFDVDVEDGLTLYYVGGIVTGFDRDDESMYWGRLTNIRNASFYYAGQDDGWRTDGTGVISFTCDFYDTYEGRTEQRESHFSFFYDFTQNKLIDLGER